MISIVYLHLNPHMQLKHVADLRHVTGKPTSKMPWMHARLQGALWCSSVARLVRCIQGSNRTSCHLHVKLDACRGKSGALHKSEEALHGAPALLLVSAALVYKRFTTCTALSYQLIALSIEMLMHRITCRM